MFAKIQITGEIELVTGMHIGGSSAFAAIGAVDSPIVKDVRTKLPMIPERCVLFLRKNIMKILRESRTKTLPA